MKRFLSALVLCTALLLLGSYFLVSSSHAKENVLLTLLNLPAPPPPNPLLLPKGQPRDAKFYDKANPPKDDAPIEDLLDYWMKQSGGYVRLRYNVEPSDKSLQRILGEIRKKPELLSQFINIFPENSNAADLAKEIYDQSAGDRAIDRSERTEIRRWLTYNSPYFSSDLERAAQQVRDVNEYVSNQEDLLALTRVDFSRAEPIINRLLNNGTNSVSKVLAKWALYRHALDGNSSIDAERYREELKAVVEDRSLPGPMRDLAMDAIVSEKEWPGRDDWYFSLLEDETLADLNGYTGLTTLILVSPQEKYVDKMIDLLGSSNLATRSAAARNLMLMIKENDPKVIKALLPWLENPKWVKPTADERQNLIRALTQIEMPESVPGLISIMNEKIELPKKNVNANSAMAMRPAVPTALTNSNMKISAGDSDIQSINVYGEFPYRNSAIAALGTQKDSRAVPALRRVLNEVDEYQRASVVRSLLMCNGFSVPEQVEALEAVAKENPVGQNARAYAMSIAANAAADAANAMSMAANAAATTYPTQTYASNMVNVQRPREIRPPTAEEIKMMLGLQILRMREPGNALVKSVVDRIETLDRRNPALAFTLRKIMISWQGKAVSAMMLRDLKNDRLESAGIVRLLAERAELRAGLQSEIYDARGGTPIAAGISSCIIGDTADYDTILSGESIEAKTALLACARLIRAQLSIQKVAENLQSKDKLLATAAERYLESEDSPEARAIVLGLYPNQAKILGATTAFAVENESDSNIEFISQLFASVNPEFIGNSEYNGIGYSNDFAKTEKRLQKEVIENADLLGIYSYENNFIRIYKDRAVYSWEDDAARSRERALTAEEFARLKDYLSINKVDELVPFLDCEGVCESKELLMLGRNGGRRVFGQFTKPPDFFVGLDKFFADVKLEPASIKYALSKDLPGLEILFADDDLQAQAVWKKGDDFRLLILSKSAREKIENDIADMEQNSTEAGEDNFYAKIEKIREDRKYEGFTWHKFTNNLGETVGQPAQAEFLPLQDSLSIKPEIEQWKARAVGFEIRNGDDGLYRVSGGKAKKIRSGNFSSVVVSANGRWAVTEKYVEKEGNSLVRINLLTGREFAIPFQDYPIATPTAFIPALNKFLIVGQDYGEEYEEGGEGESAVEPGQIQPQAFYLLDADTGLIAPAPLEMRPIAQQTFRSLQPTTTANQFWAAIPDAKINETNIGIYDARQATFRSILRIPKILFNSMNMWVDDSARKVYFVYNGHLLALPLTQPVIKSLQR